MTLLTVRNLSYSYHGFKALESISFDIKEGELVGLIGPNGSGKTTLIRCLCGILKTPPGSVELGGEDIDLMNRREIARKVSLVPQFSTTNFDFTVWETVMMGRNPHIGRLGFEGKMDREIVSWAIKTAGVEHLTRRSIQSLSGGEMQRVIVARALAQQSKLMLLDEPTAHLDINHQIEIMTLIKDLDEEKGITILVVLHDLNLAAQYCKRLILLNEGRLVGDGPPRQVVTRVNIRTAYNIDVIVKEHPLTSSLYVIPYRQTIEPPERTGKKVHLICGGGSGSRLMRMLTEKTYDVSTGVLNVLDSDYEAAEALGIRVVEEAPFSEITDEAFKRNLGFIEKSDVIVLSNMWIGPGNAKNLEAALSAAKSGKHVIVVESSPVKDRIIGGNEVLSLYDKVRDRSTLAKNDEEAIEIIEEV